MVELNFFFLHSNQNLNLIPKLVPLKSYRGQKKQKQ